MLCFPPWSAWPSSRTGGDASFTKPSFFLFRPKSSSSIWLLSTQNYCNIIWCLIWFQALTERTNNHLRGELFLTIPKIENRNCSERCGIQTFCEFISEELSSLKHLIRDSTTTTVKRRKNLFIQVDTNTID